MKILVTGANGQLGTLFRMETWRMKDAEWLFYGHDLDITNENLVNEILNKEKPNIVINCAAYTNVNKAEQEMSKVIAINAYGFTNLLKWCEKNESYLIGFSTDYIFNGDNKGIPYKEGDGHAPKNYYGFSKHLMESEAVLEHYKRYIIFRISWLYSYVGHNFLKTITEKISKGETVTVCDDQVGTPTYAPHLVEFIINFIERKEYSMHNGVYNYSDEGVSSWYDFAVEIAKCLHYEPSIVIPCKTNIQKGQAERPSFSVLDKSKFKEDFPWHRMVHWSEPICACINMMQQLEREKKRG